MPREYRRIGQYEKGIIKLKEKYNTGTEQSINLVLSAIRAPKERKWSPQSCSSTVTKTFNI